MEIRIRKFESGDVPLKVKWINDPETNRYLHYELPLSEEKTLRWFDRVKDREDRYDATVLADGQPCGTLGLLSIDGASRKAELYIAIGEAACRGKGVAAEACRLLLDHAFETLGLNRVYLYTETENKSAQRLFERLGFQREGLLREDVISNGRCADRYVYGLLRSEYEKGKPKT